jgi:anaerobic ribonucleoside-triphosphate reductase activating protein
VKLAGITWESVADGPGVRAVIFAQGCNVRCLGCHNPQALDPEGGEWYRTEELASRLAAARGLQGVTFSGGEPFLQAESFAALALALKNSGLDIVTFSGYTYEQLQQGAASMPAWTALLQQSDILIDGPFIREERDLSLGFRGSRNQRVIDLAATRSAGVVVLSPLHFRTTGAEKWQRK